MTDTEEENFNTTGRTAAAEVVHESNYKSWIHGAIHATSNTIFQELSDRDFVAKFSAGAGNDEPDFTTRVHRLTAELEFLARMLARTFPET